MEKNGSLLFSELGLSEEIQKAIDALGFVEATPIQAQAIPIIKTGVDFIGRSQTGTGKTIAFGIPAIERIDTNHDRSKVQVLILCPTRELAQQACDELMKLSKFKPGINAVDVYGGAPMDRQIFKLKRANIVIGTPGRVMDHLRRKTLKLNDLKMVVLDEADEMLSMGFKEDIETILQDAPAERQTILFSATMPPSILSITRNFQNAPHLVEIDKKSVTLTNITQQFVEVPMGRKMDALNLLLRFYQPTLGMIFCNTKKMVDDITEYLVRTGVEAEGLHGDMKQSQRTKVLNSFKTGRTSILVATDVAARGIDVNNIDYVINYDIPQSTEYYVHRIGRTGRAGKLGNAITICSGRRQSFNMRDISREVKVDIQQIQIPSVKAINDKSAQANLDKMIELIQGGVKETGVEMVAKLVEAGLSIEDIAAAALSLTFFKEETALQDIRMDRMDRNDRGGDRGNFRSNDRGGDRGNFRSNDRGNFRSNDREHGERGERSSHPRNSSGGYDNSGFTQMVLTIGRSSRVAPNHVVGAVTERTSLNGRDIGKIEIYDETTIVSIPTDKCGSIMEEMIGCKICGKPVSATLSTATDRPAPTKSFGGRGGYSGDRDRGGDRGRDSFKKFGRRPAPRTSSPASAPVVAPKAAPKD